MGRVLLFALAAYVVLAACGDPGRTEEVRPTVEDRQLAGHDSYLRALRAYGHFDDATAVRQLKQALAANPDHARALASGLLFDLPSLAGSERTRLLRRAQALLHGTDPGKQLNAADRVLLNAAVVFRKTRAAVAARALQSVEAVPDHELSFWSMTLAYRAGEYAVANRGLYQLLQSERVELRGRLYDQYARVLLHFGRNDEALSIARQYRALLPKRAEAAHLLVRALIANNKLGEASAEITKIPNAQSDDRSLALQGRLAARRGQFNSAIGHYTNAAAKAPSRRRAYHLAALALMQHFANKGAAAAATLKRCLGDAEVIAGKPLCAWLVGVRDPLADNVQAHIAALTRLSARLAAPTPLVGVLRTRAEHASLGCVGAAPVATTPTSKTASASTLNSLSLLRIRYFPGTARVPLFGTIIACYRAALVATTDPRQAADNLAIPARTRPMLLLPLARIQAAFDPAKATRTLGRFFKELAGLDKQSAVMIWAESVRSQLLRLNTKDKPSN